MSATDPMDRDLSSVLKRRHNPCLQKALSVIMIELLNSRRMAVIVVILIAVCIVVIIWEDLLADNVDKPSPHRLSHTVDDLLMANRSAANAIVGGNGVLNSSHVKHIESENTKTESKCWRFQEFEVLSGCDVCDVEDTLSKHLIACHTSGFKQLVKCHSIDEPEEDIHICGVCKQSFGDINTFVNHKKVCKHKKPLKSATHCTPNESTKKSFEKSIKKNKSLPKQKKCKPLAKSSPKVDKSLPELDVNSSESQEMPSLDTDTSAMGMTTTTTTTNTEMESDVIQSMTTSTDIAIFYSNDERPYKCQLCRYASRNSSQLVVHLRTHTALKEHMRDHNLRSLSCDYCNYTTSSRSALNTHIRTHTNEKPFMCLVCGYACRQACNLHTHMKKRHPNTDIESTPKPKTKSRNQIPLRSSQRVSKNRAYCQTIFPCHLCDCSFVREDSLRSHLRHHQDLIPTTGAALAILQLQTDEDVVDSDKQNDIIAEQTQPQELELEMDTNAKSVETVAVDSLLYQRLMNNMETNSEHSYNRSISTKSTTKRGRPLKISQGLEADPLPKPLQLVPSPTPSGQVVYHLPQSMRLVSYVPIGNNSNVDTVYVINSDAIDPNSDSQTMATDGNQ
ncbi:unnamed protein product [Medioppia subpectinata]|uniref:C2H2-type domain-containing protein n=1 Tax=Medioppia subpectinata TaxID=1979941 RepID=A0A7R9KFM0_9ACAR|nr:unnamed protein product [Medioppia subpectinata]CAG2101309.1 unnamed protein product [Medioppia subpectinata]